MVLEISAGPRYSADWSVKWFPDRCRLTRVLFPFSMSDIALAPRSLRLLSDRSTPEYITAKMQPLVEDCEKHKKCVRSFFFENQDNALRFTNLLIITVLPAAVFNYITTIQFYCKTKMKQLSKCCLKDEKKLQFCQLSVKHN